MTTTFSLPDKWFVYLIATKSLWAVGTVAIARRQISGSNPTIVFNILVTSGYHTFSPVSGSSTQFTVQAGGDTGWVYVTPIA